MRNECLKKDKTTFGIVDAKSIKNVDTATEKGYDAGKKVSGIKLHIVVDTLGLPHALHVTCANVTDRKGAEEMIGLDLDSLSSVKNFLVDGGYSGDKFANTIKRLHGATVEVVKRNELLLCQRIYYRNNRRQQGNSLPRKGNPNQVLSFPPRLSDL